jgi:hypothetical protein
VQQPTGERKDKQNEISGKIPGVCFSNGTCDGMVGKGCGLPKASNPGKVVSMVNRSGSDSFGIEPLQDLSTW